MIPRPRHPVYVISKGRWQPERAYTRRALQRDRVPFRIVVEPQEAEDYEPFVSETDEMLVLPFSNLGEGSTPARNWAWDHAKSEGHERHWIIDDNCLEFRRLWKGRRIPCDAGLALRVCEDFTDRFENVGVSGLNYQMFVPADCPFAYQVNCHAYSCVLINHAMPYRWRLRLNEDTDLCLQALVHGWCTILLNAFMVNKLRTMAMGGGNTDDLYEIGEQNEGHADTKGRFDMARHLERQWPGLVRTTRRFGRYQHSVNWKAFQNDPKLKPRPREEWERPGEYGMKLRAVKEIKSPTIRTILEEGIR